MAKPRTALDLIERLDTEYSWRRSEFHFLKSLVDRAKERDEVTAIRAAVPLLYAHWEGCIKRACCHYADHLSAQRITYSQVKVSFAGLKAHSKVVAMSEIRKQVFAPSVLLEEIRQIESERVSIDLWPHISEVGNLTFNIFSQVIDVLSLDISPYAPYKALVDDSLLYHRNKIAHGEKLDLDADRYFELHRDIIGIIECFKSDIESAAINRSYIR
jgi:hypothetical protein